MGFPHDKFGLCPRCGRGGLDDGLPTGTGYKLKQYMGQWLCQLCINELKDEAYDKVAIEKDNQEESFRESIGFTK